jgi:hypothetical protein
MLYTRGASVSVLVMPDLIFAVISGGYHDGAVRPLALLGLTRLSGTASSRFTRPEKPNP